MFSNTQLDDFSGTELTRMNTREGQQANQTRNIFTFDIDETDSDDVSESMAASKVNLSRLEVAD